MANAPFSTSGFGRQLLAAAGTLRPMKVCTFGTSHMTSNQSFGMVLMYALARYHNADLIFRHRGVLTSTSNSTVIADRGDAYATATATSAHMVGPQLTQFNADVAAGMRFDLLFTDGGLYNDAPADQAALDLAMTRTMTLLDAFFAAPNNGAVAVIYGTFGINPTLCQAWAAMWRFKEATSNGRIRFVDTASVLGDPANTSRTVWAWKGGTNVFGAYTSDGTHLSEQGARAVALPVANVLRDICPRTFNWPVSGAASLYDPANMRWANVLGDGGAMIGSNGLDSAGGGTVTGTVPGTGASGFNDRWYLETTGSVTRSSAITTNARGDREMGVTIGGSAANFDVLQFKYQAAMASVNNGVASRKFMMGAEVEMIGVTGLASMFLRANQATTWDTPFGNTTPADGWPDTTSETLLLRSLYPVAWSGANPNFQLVCQFRAKNPVAGTIKVRRAFLTLVEE